MGWSEQNINTVFYNIEQIKKKRTKKIFTNTLATIAVIAAITIILLIAPKSPIKIQPKPITVSGGEYSTSAENIDSVLYDNETGERKNIPPALAEKIAENQRLQSEAEEQRIAELNQNRPEGYHH